MGRLSVKELDSILLPSFKMYKVYDGEQLIRSYFGKIKAKREWRRLRADRRENIRRIR